jgi:hypothetical protein
MGGSLGWGEQPLIRFGSAGREGWWAGMTRRTPDHSSPGPGKRAALPAACLLLVAMSTGCTMCPDPFDYSGPVPNGSVPQNDFLARSNGILPLQATPKPWPTLVDQDNLPTPAEPLDLPKPEVAAVPRSVLVPQAEEDEPPAVAAAPDESADESLQR